MTNASDDDELGLDLDISFEDLVGPPPTASPPPPPIEHPASDEDEDRLRLSAVPPPHPTSTSDVLSLANVASSMLGPTEATPASAALALVEQRSSAAERPSAPTLSESPEREMRSRLDLGDYSGALFVAEALLEDHPDHVEAARCARECREMLAKMYATRIGSTDRVPIVVVPREQLKWLSIDHRAGFILSLIDGRSTLVEILDVSGMPELDALRILYELSQQRVISFR